MMHLETFTSIDIICTNLVSTSAVIEINLLYNLITRFDKVKLNNRQIFHLSFKQEKTSRQTSRKSNKTIRY